MARLFTKLKDNKGLTGLLVIAVVVIWGTVILRVVEKPASSQITRKQNNEPGRIDLTDSLDFTLSLNYDDPFGLTTTPTRKKLVARTPALINPKIAEEPTSTIVYLGSVVNDSGSKTALISYRGKYYYAGLNERIGVYKVTSINLDSVKFTSHSRVFWIVKE